MRHHLTCHMCLATITTTRYYVHDTVITVAYHEVCHARLHRAITRQTGQQHVCMHSEVNV